MGIVISLSRPGGVVLAEDLLRGRLGEAIRALRGERGMTLEQLARLAGVSRSHLSDIERGTKEASSEVIRSIHRALGLSLDELLDRVGRSDLPEARLLTVAA